MTAHTKRIRSELLILRVRRGDTAAFTELVALWERPLFYYLRRMLKTEEDTWDALQEVWLRVFKKVAQLRAIESFPSWLYQIARNSAYNHRRDNPDWKSLADATSSAIHDADDGALDLTGTDAEAVHLALSQLPLPQREALTLHFLEEFTLQEISSITGAAVGTIKSRLYYGKRALREVLLKKGEGHE